MKIRRVILKGSLGRNSQIAEAGRSIAFGQTLNGKSLLSSSKNSVSVPKFQTHIRMGTAAPDSSRFRNTMTHSMTPLPVKNLRPQTGAFGEAMFAGIKASSSLGVMKQLNASPALGSTRAASAGFALKSQKVIRYETLINRFKKKLESETRLLRTMKTLQAQEIKTKNTLEKFLRQCVQDVKNEIYRKRTENKSNYIALGKKGR